MAIVKNAVMERLGAGEGGNCRAASGHVPTAPGRGAPERRALPVVCYKSGRSDGPDEGNSTQF